MLQALQDPLACALHGRDDAFGDPQHGTGNRNAERTWLLQAYVTSDYTNGCTAGFVGFKSTGSAFYGVRRVARDRLPQL